MLRVLTFLIKIGFPRSNLTAAQARGIINYGTRAGIRDMLATAKIENNLPLHWVARAGSTGDVNKLLLAGANINELDEKGRSPVIYAIIAGNINMLKYLLQSNVTLETEKKWYLSVNNNPIIQADKHLTNEIKYAVITELLAHSNSVGHSGVPLQDVAAILSDDEAKRILLKFFFAEPQFANLLVAAAKRDMTKLVIELAGLHSENRLKAEAYILRMANYWGYIDVIQSLADRGIKFKLNYPVLDKRGVNLGHIAMSNLSLTIERDDLELLAKLIANVAELTDADKDKVRAYLSRKIKQAYHLTNSKVKNNLLSLCEKVDRELLAYAVGNEAKVNKYNVIKCAIRLGDADSLNEVLRYQRAYINAQTKAETTLEFAIEVLNQKLITAGHGQHSVGDEGNLEVLETLLFYERLNIYRNTPAKAIANKKEALYLAIEHGLFEVVELILAEQMYVKFALTMRDLTEVKGYLGKTVHIDREKEAYAKIEGALNTAIAQAGATTNVAGTSIIGKILYFIASKLGLVSSTSSILDNTNAAQRKHKDKLNKYTKKDQKNRGDSAEPLLSLTSTSGARSGFFTTARKRVARGVTREVTREVARGVARGVARRGAEETGPLEAELQELAIRANRK